MWLCLLGAVRCGDYSSDLRCAANPSSIKFTLKSYRNQTGHWKAQVSNTTTACFHFHAGFKQSASIIAKNLPSF